LDYAPKDFSSWVLDRPCQGNLNRLVCAVVLQACSERNRWAHHDRNEPLAVRPEPVEGSLSKDLFRVILGLP